LFELTESHLAQAFCVSGAAFDVGVVGLCAACLLFQHELPSIFEALMACGDVN